MARAAGSLQTVNPSFETLLAIFSFILSKKYKECRFKHKSPNVTDALQFAGGSEPSDALVRVPSARGCVYLCVEVESMGPARRGAGLKGEALRADAQPRHSLSGNCAGVPDRLPHRHTHITHDNKPS